MTANDSMARLTLQPRNGAMPTLAVRSHMSATRQRLCLRIVELLERDTVRDKLLGWLAEAATTEGRLVLLAGEAGVGKTALVQQFCRLVVPKYQVLTGGCDPLSTPRPLEPLFDIADQVGGELERSLQRDDGRHGVFRIFLSSLQRAGRPSVVVFEDVHWADEATLDLVRFLGRRIATTECLLIASYRDDEVGPKHPLQVIIGDLATLPAVRKLSLAPLSQAAVGTLAEGSDVDTAELYSRTNGNPFFVTEVLASGASGVPATVRDAVLARASRLSQEGREALDAAAVIGARIDPRVLMAVTGAAAVARATPVEECLASGILLSRADELVFRHELAREALYDSIPLPHRISLHARILRALESSASAPGHLAQLAHHAEQARDTDAVCRFAPAAARKAASLRSHREAVAQYARALRFAGDMSPDEHAALLDAFAEEAGLVDRQEEAISARRQSVRIWGESGRPLLEGNSLNALAVHLVRAGFNREAEQASLRALDLLESVPPGSELARAYMTQGYLRMLNRDCQESMEWCRKVFAMPEALADETIRAETQNVLGTAQLMAGENEAGVANLEKVAELASSSGDDRLTALAHMQLGSGSGELYDFARAEHNLRKAIGVAVENDLDGTHLYSLAWLALTRFYLGSWDEAAETAKTVIKRPGTAATSRIMALIAIGRIRVRRGDPEAGEVLDEAVDLATETGTLQRIAPVRAARAEGAWQAGDHSKAADEANTAYDLARRYRHPWFVGELAYWRWKAGESQEVPAEAADPFALQIKGRWREAAAAWNALGCPFEEARAIAEGNDVTEIRRALRMFEELGARPAATAAARRLRELGAAGIPRGPRASTRSNPANLTAREVQILQKLDEGLRNAEIAAGLHLSPKTVGHHVSSILAKLGVRNRTEAAREAAALGLLKDREPNAQN